MVAETDLFEAASIVTFYYAVDKGADLTPNQDIILFEDLKKEFPNMDKEGMKDFLNKQELL